MITCKECKFWKAADQTCSNLKFVYTGRMSSDEMEPDGLGYWDYECYDVGFSTGPDFGCIHAKTNEPQCEILTTNIESDTGRLQGGTK